MKLRFTIAAALVAATSSLTASAQPWVADRGLGEGGGIKAGNLELHPSVAGELGYDSNYFQRAEEEGIIDVYRLRLTPSLTLSTQGVADRGAQGAGSPVVFSAGVHVGLNHLIAADSDDSDVVEDHTPHVNAGANFKLDVLANRPWGFDMYGDWARTIEPNNGPSGDAEQAFDRDSFRLGAGINWRPGGGLFHWRAGYELQYHLFERDTFQLFNNARHSVNTRGRWRFLPRTALVYDGSYSWVRYANDTSANEGETITTRIGINGLITYHFALLAMAGWAGSFYDSASANGELARNYDDFVAQAELKWFLMAQPSMDVESAPVGLSTVAVGYTRNFSVSYLGSFYQRDRGYLKFNYFISNLAVVSLEGGYARYSYPESQVGAVQFGEFEEDRIDAQLFAEYRVAPMFGLNTTLRYMQAIAVDDVRPYGENIEYSRYQAWIGARWFL
jgi:hypothetical protein